MTSPLCSVPGCSGVGRPFCADHHHAWEKSREHAIATTALMDFARRVASEKANGKPGPRLTNGVGP